MVGVDLKVIWEMSAKSWDGVAKRMTPAQIAEAQKLARKWWAKHNKKK